MNFNEAQALADRYQDLFGNLDDLAHPSIMCDERFIALLEKAIADRSPLTEAELESVFGPIHWEEESE